ncbi:MAG: hypothetical protein H7Z41_04865 [Cytophagales bacterium]|nr:hypothetical protein [Armatimonadota bacterium]
MTLQTATNPSPPLSAPKEMPVLARLAQFARQFKQKPFPPRPGSRRIARGIETAPLPTHSANAAAPAAVPAKATPLSSPVWQAWRERGDGSGSTVIQVVGACLSPPEGCAGQIVLQEIVLSAQKQQQWAGGAGSCSTSGVLVLERLVVPPPFGAAPAEGGDRTHRVCFRRQETPLNLPSPFLAPRQSATPIAAAAPVYTHVTILPDNVVIAIQDRA